MLWIFLCCWKYFLRVFYVASCLFFPCLAMRKLVLLIHIWPWGTDKNLTMSSQKNKIDGTTLICCIWLQMSWCRMHSVSQHLTGGALMISFYTMGVFFLIFFVELRTDLKLDLLFNSLAFRNAVKMHDSMNIENSLYCWLETVSRVNIIFNVFSSKL